MKDDAASKEVIQTRCIMWCPLEFIPLFIGKNLPPREAFMTGYLVIKDKGMLTKCAYLVNFLRVACTHPSDGGVLLVVQKNVRKNVVINGTLQYHML